MQPTTETNFIEVQTEAQTYSVVLNGIQSHANSGETIPRLASLFKISQEHVVKLVSQPGYIVKKGLPLGTANHYKRTIEDAGAVCEVKSEGSLMNEIDLSSMAAPSEIASNTAAPAASTYTTTGTPAVNTTPSGASTKKVLTTPTLDRDQFNVAELKESINMTTLTFVMLSMVTIGLYPILWLTRHFDTINRVTKKKTIDMNYITWIAVCDGISLALSNSADSGIATISTCAYIASVVLLIVWSFKVKAALQNYALETFKIDLKMNPFYIIAFHAWYINYCINDLPEVLRKHQVLKDKSH